MAVTAIDDTEKNLLKGISVVLALMGGLGGLGLGLTLAHAEAIDPDYWSELLKVIGVASLPLVGVAVRIPRLTGGTSWSKPARRFVLAAFPVVVLIIGTCLNRIALKPATGSAATSDWTLVLTAVGAGLVVAAIAVGVIADVLDKIDG